MATRMVGKTKLTPEVRQRLVEVARELVYGSAGCPEWGTTFAEIESDACEVGFELMRLLMEQTNTQQVPNEAWQAKSGEVATPIGVESLTLETESGEVSWKEPAAYLPKSRKSFFLSRRRWAWALTKSCLRP